MKIKFMLIFSAALFTAAVLHAQKATIIRMTGDQDVKLITESGEEVPLARGAELNEGDFIQAGPNTKVFIRTFEGAITTLTEGSAMEIVTVQKQDDGRETTVVRLERGSVVANLDPSKTGIHDYGVETPKGVAAARGTNYSVSVNGFEVLVTVSGGVVSFTIPQVATPIVLNPGGVTTGGAATTLAAALSDPATASAVSQAMQATAAAVATLVNEPNSGVTNDTLAQVVTTAANASAQSGDGGSLVALVAATAAQTNPAVAEVVVQAAVAATSGSSSSTAVANNVVASVTRAAAQASGVPVSTLASSLSQVANTASGGSVTINPTTIENAVNQSQGGEPGAGEGTGTGTGGETGETGTETEVDVEVPNDNIIVSPST